MSGALSMYDGLEPGGTSNSDALEVGGGVTKKLSRGISRATENDALVNKARLQLASSDGLEAPEYTFSLPDLSVYPEPFRQFLEKDLFEAGCLSSLEAAGRLNWWCGGRNDGSRALWPLATIGDGNCLLHAASLGIWGFHDRKLTMREHLHNMLAEGEYRDAIFRRWKWRQTTLNATAGLAYTESEWQQEWQSVVDMASINPRNQTNTSYQSLEEVHVLALAHVLRRPIIIIAETMLRDSEGVALAPITFGGIYLPLEVASSECHRTPLLLAYHSAHFSPLVSVARGQNNEEGISVPLVDPETGQLLPVPFAVDPGPDWDWTASQDLLSCSQDTMEILVREYLDCEYQTLAMDEMERFCDGDGSSMNRNKTTKQLLGVAKQFGSIGKSMSKKFWLMTKRPKSPPATSSSSSSSSSPAGPIGEGVLSVKVKITRHGLMNQMVQNYLDCAQERYLQDHHSDFAGTAMNYGAGKSKFYASSDSCSHASVSKLPPSSSSNKDQTLYLANSTFFCNTSQLPDDDKDSVRKCRSEQCQFFGSPENQYYCSQCWANRRQR
ncbi:OTU domain-containing protein 7B-like [Belonocnema kinseyi]|uniref:OTU domain-containing protein 7B-like n=1 Tax=Belonocnema kinseyi TaxID=2817044 RepID=UPI00143CDF82|nr:OTU domain-containing protein 7B-like [Belonocnema kinseyi]XP_033222193.1 OTU domain-containing protein 7B-like [Belonocnema kinseyi]XP_033222194.1 OTU domain-containing protein 7B-like [Belonocnema kinseyi]XP_033222195.1 OTU domain-containing protein 7B-like [Belonocnema kinseyi]XP_033222196.1 OTU domain-containing protein 7B-like [Belonocnema kinseyi]XP_033222197.1 OTU domain-containing protein 7B-like [Belonocnema kinseyi]XP_033222198.1 OTU domain-containing protein 7B-like [Belonocnema